MRRKKKNKNEKPRLNITIMFTIIVMCEITATVGIATVLSHVLDVALDTPSMLWLWLISLTVGFFISAFVNQKILYPIRRLSKAMTQVASGNFNITLEQSGKIREIQNIYESFNLMARELSATEILKTDFVSNVSHEIKTPVSAVEGYATLLQSEENLSPAGKEYIDKILFNTRRLSELVGNILLLSKIDNTAIESKTATFRLDEQIRRAVMLLEPKWAEKETDFDIEMQNVTFTGNDGLLFHVWTNLIDNAIKFSPVGGKITIELRKNDDSVNFVIDDEGQGIPKEAQKHIFDKFYQADSSHKQNGNGLGLALVKKILTLHGGSIDFENLPQNGCRFSVYLPVQKNSKKVDT